MRTRVLIAGLACACRAAPPEERGLELGERERIADLDDARPGDFVQAWTSDRSLGHSMVFLGWHRDASGSIAGMRYWSSQPWTDGIGESEATIGGDEADFDRAQIHVARARCPIPARIEAREP